MPDYQGMPVRPTGRVHARRNNPPPVSRPRSVFPMNAGVKTTFNTGFVIPVKWWTVLPGDTWTVKMSALARLITLIRPIMDNMYCDVHFVYCPMRLVWDHTEEFFGQQANPGDSTSYVIPQGTPFDPVICGFFDYAGLNPVTAGGANVTVNTLQWRAYREIWNQLYRDENLQSSVTCPKDDGPDTVEDVVLRRGKRGDRFTTCVPWPQKGTAVPLPVGGSVAVSLNAPHSVPTFWNVTTGTNAGAMQRAAAGANTGVNITLGGAAGEQIGWNNPNLLVNLAGVTGGPTVADWRQAMALQVYLERNARGGTRYVEYLKSQWGVTSSDSRLQRPEYLGGGTFPVNISAIAQTSETNASVSPQGNLSGVATVSGGGIGFTYSAEEHGFIFCLVSIRSEMSYMQGARPEFFWRTVYDVPNPVFANVGDEPVYNREIYFNNDGNDGLVFGYQERYSAMKQDWSICTGYMRSNTTPNSLDTWHVAQNYSSLPALNSTFIQEPYTNVDRVVAVPSALANQWSFDCAFDATVARCLPAYGIPGVPGYF